MTKRIDSYDTTYGHFNDSVLQAIREEAYGKNIGQNSWLTIDEYDRFISWLGLEPDHHALEVACGSGGPAIYLADRASCRVTGIDSNESGIATANLSVVKSGLTHRLSFGIADANSPLPFQDNTFDAIICIDSMNHLPRRLNVLKEWHRVLRPGHRAVFTDPVVITGPVTNDELASRSSIGLFLFVPPGVNEQLIELAGFRLIQQEDVTENAALISGRRYQARQRYKKALLQIEGEEGYEEQQQFLATVNRLTTERRLSRISYLIEKHTIK